MQNFPQITQYVGFETLVKVFTYALSLIHTFDKKTNLFPADVRLRHSKFESFWSLILAGCSWL